MTASGQASQLTQMPFVLHIDTIGSLANHAGVHTLNCGEKIHLENVLSVCIQCNFNRSFVHGVGRARISQVNL